MRNIYLFMLLLVGLAAFADDQKYLLFYSGGEEILRLGASEVDSIVIARNTVTPPRPDVPEGAVDLGLSVMWAQCNLGARHPGTSEDTIPSEHSMNRRNTTPNRIPSRGISATNR